MGKELSEMTLEELWELFPVFLVAQMPEQNGFIIMSSEAKRISLNKGYTENGFADEVYHIHLRLSPDGRQKHERNTETDTDKFWLREQKIMMQEEK